MPLNFPTTGLTANETTYTFSGNTWIWNGYAWDTVVNPASVGLTAYVRTWNGQTGDIVFSNYVTSVNGLTGVVTGIAVTGSNTFTGLQTMNAGISASSLYVSGGITSSPYSVVDGIPLNPVVLDSAKIQLGDLNGVGENVKLIIDNYEGNNIRAYGNFYVYDNLYSNWIRPSSGSSIKIGNTSSSIVIGDDGVANNTKIVIYDPTQILNIVNANGVINIGDVYGTNNSTKLIVDDTTNTVTVNGNLTVSGGITSTFSETVLIEDNFILLNSNLTAGGPTADAGIEISRGASANVQLRWNETTDRWQFTNDGTQFYDLPTSVVSSWNGSTGVVTFSDYVVSVNGSTGAITNVAKTDTAQTFTALQSFSIGITAAGATFTQNLYANVIKSNQLNVQNTTSNIIGDYTNTLGGGYIQIDNSSGQAFNRIAGTLYTDAVRIGSAAVPALNVTGSIYTSGLINTTARVSCAGITSSGVSTFTGSLTSNNLYVSQGATFNSNAVFVSGLSADDIWITNGATFSSRSSFNAGITTNNLWVTNGATFNSNAVFVSGLSADDIWVTNGATFSSNTTFLSGIQTDSVFATSGIGGTVYINSDSNGNGGNSITYIGDWGGSNNGTSITVDDQSAAISLNGTVVCDSTVNSVGFITTGDVYFGGASAFLSSQSTTLGTTAANQNIASVEIYDGVVNINRTVEFFVQASHSSGYEALKIIAIHDGTNTYNTQYGLIRTGSSLCSSYTTTITNAGSVLRLRATPTNTNTTFKVVETVIPV